MLKSHNRPSSDLQSIKKIVSQIRQFLDGFFISSEADIEVHIRRQGHSGVLADYIAARDRAREEATAERQPKESCVEQKDRSPRIVRDGEMSAPAKAA